LTGWHVRPLRHPVRRNVYRLPTDPSLAHSAAPC
jgi:hypothetical protein